MVVDDFIRIRPEWLKKNVVGGLGYQLVYSRVELETYGLKTRCAAINGNYPRSFYLIALPGSSMLTNKGKGKIDPGTGYEVPKAEERYCFTLSLISEVDGAGNQRLAPATLVPVTLPPGRTRYPLYRRWGWAQSRSRRVRKISFLLRFDPWTVHPIASPYID
jgi:hypothetical protein